MPAIVLDAAAALGFVRHACLRCRAGAAGRSRRALEGGTTPLACRAGLAAGVDQCASLVLSCLFGFVLGAHRVLGGVGERGAP